jgi:hypothetical protein
MDRICTFERRRVQVIPALDHNTLPGSKEFREAVHAFVLSARRSR